MSQPAFALLLDVDGPIASPDEKAIVQPTIVPSLVTLINAGIPVVFNTGRPDAFIRQQVLAPLLSSDLKRVDRLHAICEKGPVWLSINDDHTVQQQIDADIAVPQEMWDAIKEVSKNHTAAMFFDPDERTMVSVERNVHTTHDEYMAAQPAFCDEAFKVLTDMGYGVQLGDRVQPDAGGNVPWRIDPSIIAVDIEAVVVGKHMGAERAYKLLKADDALPVEWRTMGDSNGDYAMGEWLAKAAEQVKHIEVRPLSVPSRSADFEVLRPQKTTFDAAGAAYLLWLIDHLDGGTAPEERFDA